ncbi:MAG: ATP-binding cassette domain-containing protein [Verrucomicrobia bacterium]|nr:ATP-binding cassette domain-containing protein [Verrucomicrobiota bacterium]
MTTSEIPPRSGQFQNWLRLFAFLTPYRARFGGALLFGVVNGLTSLALMKGVPRVWDAVFGNRSSSPSLAAAIILLVPLIMLARAISGYLSAYLMSWVGTRVITDIRQKVFAHIQDLSLDFFNHSNVGDLISRINNDCQQAQSAITSVVADAIKHPFTLIVVAGALLHKDWRFSLAAVLLAPLCILPITIYGRKVRRASKLAQENQGEIVSRLHENITGVRVVKAFHMEEHEKQKFWETCFRQFGYQMKMVRSINILSPMIELVAAMGASAALYYAWQSQMRSADFWELLLGIFFLYDPIKNLSKLHTTLQKSLASTDRILAILDAKSSVVEAPAARELAPVRAEIRLEKVSFRYDSQWVLREVSLAIPHGTTVALVGPSGAGKTTLLNLLPRFYDPAEGRVLMDGTDLREVTLRSLRSQIALVTQDTILFNDTIRNNIRYGSMEASEAQVEAAARRAHAHDFILHQPFGYDTVVGEKGVKLSGGQKQRLAIARAILKNPRILLLDEATSALDTESERAVQAALDELIQGRTVVVIAHRLSTVQKADIIVVLDDGRIMEQGSHADLMAGGKLYRRLHDLQFHGDGPGGLG